MRRLDPSARFAILMALILGISAPLLGQAQRPLHVLTPEFTALSSLMGMVACAWIGARFYRSLPAGPERAAEALWRGLAFAALLGAITWATHMTVNQLWHDCKPGAATLYFWLTWPPTAALGSVLGVLAAERHWKTWQLLTGLSALALASGLNDGLQYLNGVRIIDPLIGDPMAFNQRNDLSVDPMHAVQRGWLWLTVVAVWFGGRWLNARTQARQAALTLTVWAGLTLGFGSWIGVGWGDSFIRSHLDATHETEHFVIRYPSSGETASEIDAIARNAEWYWRQITEAWQIDPTRRVALRIFDRSADLARYTGIRAPHAGAYQIDLTLEDAFDRTLPHELVHALHPELTWNPRLLLSRGMIEGSAVAFAEHKAEVADTHAIQAGALKADILPHAQDFMGSDGFTRVNESNAYNSAGSFIGFLVLEHGIDKFLSLQRSLDYEAVYGQDLAQLDTAWRAFLQTVEVSVSEQGRARTSYDPQLRPSYRQKQCPKLKPRVEPPIERGKRLASEGHELEALQVWLALYEEDGKPRWAEWAAQSLAKLGRYDETLSLTEAALTKTDLEDDQRFRLLYRKIRTLAAMGDWERLETALVELDALEEPDPRLERTATLLRDPVLREPIARFETLGLTTLGRRYLLDQVDAHPDNEALRFYAAVRGGLLYGVGYASYVKAQDRARIDEFLSFLDGSAGACDELDTQILRVTDWAIQTESWDLATRLVDATERACVDPGPRFEARKRRARIAWETGPDTR